MPSGLYQHPIQGLVSGLISGFEAGANAREREQIRADRQAELQANTDYRTKILALQERAADPLSFYQNLRDRLASQAESEGGEGTGQGGQSLQRLQEVDSMIAQLTQRKREDFILSPGQTRFDAQGKPIAALPEKKEKAQNFTLSPGQSVYDAQGNLIAKAPEKIEPGFSLSEGQTRFDAQGKPIAEMGKVTKPQTPENAAKTQLLQDGLNNVASVRSGLIKEGGVDRSVLLQMSTNAPFTQGRLLRSQIADAVEAKLRAESGAAVPETEVKRMAQRFVPVIADSDAQIIDKLNRLERFLGGSLERILPPESAGSTESSAKGKVMEKFGLERRRGQ